MKTMINRLNMRVFTIIGLFIMMPISHAGDSPIQEWIDDTTASGANLAISAAHYQDGDVSYYAGGSTRADNGAAIDADTQFQIGSITKTFTNLLLAEMVARGELSYDTTIADILGDGVAFSNPAVGDITMMQLATHTSGLPRLPVNLAPSDPLNPYKGYDDEKLLAGLAQSRARQPLGNNYGYSNFGVGLLGYLLGRVHGDDYHAALQSLVIEPMKLAETGFVASNASAGFRGGEVVPDWSLDSLDGAGSLWSSASDMMQMAAVQLGARDIAWKHSITDDLIVREDASPGFRLTRVWHVADSDKGAIYYHNGGTGGFWSFFGFRPASNEALVILVSGDTDPTSLGLKTMARLPFDVEDSPLDTSVFGQYQLTPDVGIGVYDIEGTLVGQVTGQTPQPLNAIGDDWYAIQTVDASVHFVRENNDVVALELAQNSAVQKAPRVADAAQVTSRETVDVARDTLSDYAGEYPINATAKFTIRVTDTGLEAQITGQPFLPIFASGDDVFFYKVVDAELRFERDADGEVNALVLHQGSIVQRAEKTR